MYALAACKRPEQCVWRRAAALCSLQDQVLAVQQSLSQVQQSIYYMSTNILAVKNAVSSVQTQITVRCRRPPMRRRKTAAVAPAQPLPAVLTEGPTAVPVGQHANPVAPLSAATGGAIQAT